MAEGATECRPIARGADILTCPAFWLERPTGLDGGRTPVPGRPPGFDRGHGTTVLRAGGRPWRKPDCRLWHDYCTTAGCSPTTSPNRQGGYPCHPSPA